MKSDYLETLEKLQKALTVFDMSFSVSNKVFRLALVTEILDTTCLFEQLYNSWCEHLPFGEGPDADVDFTKWKDLSCWESLLSGANQNACIDDYPFDMGNGMTSDMIPGNRRKNYLKSVSSIFRRSEYSGSEVASNFIKEVNTDHQNSMTFGEMVHDALSSLRMTLGKIDNLLANPDKSLYSDYFERQESRFYENYEACRKRIQDIMSEDSSTRRKCNKLHALNDELLRNLYESNFLDVLKNGINVYDINDYRRENVGTDKSKDEICEELAFEELVDKNKKPNKEKAGQYIFKNRKNLSFDDISSFYVYLYAIPLISIEIEKLNVVETGVQPQRQTENVEVVDDAVEVSGETEARRDDAELVEKLKPIFYNNEADVKVFLKEISGMQPNNITDLVNTWVKDQRISNYGNSRKGVLWEILNDAGLYPKSRQNWCRRVY